jgi:hypothetical protein
MLGDHVCNVVFLSRENILKEEPSRSLEATADEQSEGDASR